MILSQKHRFIFIKPAVWDDYFTFCVERNPWDRAAYYYHYWAAHEDDPCDFSTFLSGDSLPFLKRLGRDLFTIDGKVAVDKVCLYENLEEGLREVFGAVGIDARVNLPRAKSGFRPSGKSYRALYKDADRAFVEAWASSLIEEMGYEF